MAFWNKKSKQVKKDKGTERSFSEFIETHIKLFTIDDGFFKAIYLQHMEAFKINNKELDNIIESLPTLKAEYESAVQSLVELSENNTVFFTDKKYEEMRQNTDFLLNRRAKETEDIIKTLPCIANFVDIHDRLVNKVYEEVFKWKVLRAEETLWLGIRYNSDDGEHFKKLRDTCVDVIISAYNICLDECWNKIIGASGFFDTEAYHEMFIEIARSKFDDKFLEPWQKNMKKISDSAGYLDKYFELHNFFDEVMKKHNNPIWLDTYCGIDNMGSSFWIKGMKEVSKEEILRILDLYKSGKMKGRYSWIMDPKYNP